MDNQLSRLTDIGFQPVGHWLPDGTGMMMEIDSHAKSRNVLYAFVVDGQPTYIGKTTRELRSRMSMYRNAGQKQSTNIKNRRLIVEAMSAGRVVEIYALPDNGLLHYGGFHINLAAGLEDSLIRELNPPWNGGRKETWTGELEPVDTSQTDVEVADTPGEAVDLDISYSEGRNAPRKRLFVSIANRLGQGALDEVVVPFAELETWLGESLPLLARQSPQWWSSGRAIWAEAGWKVSPLLAQSSVRFRRVRAALAISQD